MYYKKCFVRTLYEMIGVTDRLVIHLKMLEPLFISCSIILVGFIVPVDVTREQFGVFDIFIRLHFNRYHEETKAHDQHYRHHSPPLHISYANIRRYIPDVHIAAR